MLECNELSKKYKNKPEFAVKNVSFKVSPGEIIGLIGPNGSGKSTLIKMLLGVLKPTSGSVCLLGKNPMNFDKNDKKKVAVLLGGKSSLVHQLPLIDSIKYNAVIYEESTKCLDEKIKVLAQKLNIQHKLSSKVATLSLGEKLRGELLSLLVYDPKMYFLDEPTLGLDLEGKIQFRKILEDVTSSSSSSVILTTHDFSDIEKIADRIYFLNHGELILSLERLEFQTLINSHIVISIETDDNNNKYLEGAIFLDSNKGISRYLLPAQDKMNILKNLSESVIYYKEEKPKLEDVLYQYYL